MIIFFCQLSSFSESSRRRSRAPKKSPFRGRDKKESWEKIKKMMFIKKCVFQTVMSAQLVVGSRIRTGVATATTWSTNHYTNPTTVFFVSYTTGIVKINYHRLLNMNSRPVFHKVAACPSSPTVWEDLKMFKLVQTTIIGKSMCHHDKRKSTKTTHFQYFHNDLLSRFGLTNYWQ